MRFFQLHEVNVGERGDELSPSTCLLCSYS